MSLHQNLFSQLINLVMPNGGLIIVITIAPDIYPVYADSSYGPDHPYLCVGGYIFTPDKAKEMSRKWAAILASHALPYFHMCECNGGYEKFAHLDEDERIAIASQMIQLTREYSEMGFVVALDPIEYEELLPTELRAQSGSAYSFALRECLTLTRRWAERKKFLGRFAFFFEEGDEYAGEAREIISGYKQPGLADRFLFHSVTFVGKEDAEPLQSADILAWQAYVHFRRASKGKEIRKDLAALLREEDMAMILTREKLTRITVKLREHYGLTV